MKIVCVALMGTALPAHAEMTVIDEGEKGESALKGSIVPTKPLPVWTLTAGRTVGQELKTWGERAGWHVIWSLSKDWSVPASTSFSGEFPAAAADVVKTLAANGALIRAQIFDGNKTFVVVGPGVSE